ncbi:hypothetical protein E5843_06675 [Luteimonas yindakuii]|uniref:hypothetical protein n=1 Tax=Luteimonas yindakuii TaxID=2565782 RepID=UPI0010A50C63|nr:hypothetical protein [Luteimonas yindakuii]QCO67533.1 hypothetical protein E5843_06675 [Luteimonas yindakuii]
MREVRKKSWLDQYRTHWQWYREFFSVSILRYFVVWFSIVPIALSLLQAVPAQIQINAWSVNIRPSLPFSWTILWFASLAYTVALLLFTACCPYFIKKYPSFAHYKSVGHSPRWLVWLAFDIMKSGGAPWKRLSKRLSEKGYLVVSKAAGDLPSEPEILERGTVLSFIMDDVRYEFVMPREDAEKTDGAEREIYWEIFGAHSGSRRLFRLAIILLLILALVLFGIVLLQHVCSALPAALGNLLELLFGMWGWIFANVSRV